MADAGGDWLQGPSSTCGKRPRSPIDKLADLSAAGEDELDWRSSKRYLTEVREEALSCNGLAARPVAARHAVPCPATSAQVPARPRDLQHSRQCCCCTGQHGYGKHEECKLHAAANCSLFCCVALWPYPETAETAKTAAVTVCRVGLQGM